MEYREIVAVTGIGGLFQLLTTKSDGAIVRNLTDKTTKFIPARVHNVTPIESIEIYTIEENVRLHEVLQAIKDNEAISPIVDVKKADNTAIKNYFKQVFPSLDEDRVYVSDMKKIIKWYQLLKVNNLLNFDASVPDAAAESSAIEEEVAIDEAPAKKAKAKKEVVASEDAEKPAKKAKAKKAVADIETEEPKKVAKKKKTEE